MADAASPGARLEVDGDTLRLAGDLGFATVAGLLAPGRRAIAALPGPCAVLDFSAVGRSDSAGLALVVDWLRAARGRDLDLQLRAVPRQLADIARLSDLDTLVAGEPDGAS